MRRGSPQVVNRKAQAAFLEALLQSREHHIIEIFGYLPTETIASVPGAPERPWYSHISVLPTPVSCFRWILASRKPSLYNPLL